MNDVVIHALTCQADGRVILDIPSLTVLRGERVAIIGSNGAGKSTLLRVLGGSLCVPEAEVQVLGRKPGLPAYSKESRQWSSEVGQLHQGLHLVGRLSALENVLIGSLHRVTQWRSWLRWFPSDLLAQAHAALDQVGLQGRADTRTDQLSGGERQKVSLARLQLQQPRLILADEPTSALDPHAAQLAARWLGVHFDGITTLTVVHHPDLLPLLADRVLGLRAGRIVLDSPVKDVSEAQLRFLYEATP
ncbi:MAG: ATP-binding cassette domain-containing protein [Rhodoferax sp.]|nr:ATP-binding cassette domain-containing protein [Rhodoferax sp.]